MEMKTGLVDEDEDATEMYAFSEMSRNQSSRQVAEEMQLSRNAGKQGD